MAKNEVRSDEEETPNKKCVLCCFPKRRFLSSKNGTPPIIKEVLPKEESAKRVPYNGDLPKNLAESSVIRITGRILPTCIRFAVDLTVGNIVSAGASSGLTSGDIGFHLNPRLDRNFIVRNSMIRGLWGNEETASPVKLKLGREDKFDIALFVASDEFLVSVNGEHFCSYRMRVPLHLLSGIVVRGDVEVYDIRYENWTSYPQGAESGDPKCQMLVPRSKVDDDVTDESALTQPCTAHLPKGFQVGWQLNIHGRVKLLPHSFYINLQDGAQLWPHPIIPLHLNPRFIGAAKENVFVRNAWIDGKWGSEERSPVFQFAPGTPFNLAVQRAFDHFSVWVDGQLAGEFKFRTAVDKIDAVYIQGDVVINQIVLHEEKVDPLGGVHGHFAFTRGDMSPSPP